MQNVIDINQVYALLWNEFRVEGVDLRLNEYQPFGGGHEGKKGTLLKIINKQVPERFYRKS